MFLRLSRSGGQSFGCPVRDPDIAPYAAMRVGKRSNGRSKKMIGYTSGMQYIAKISLRHFVGREKTVRYGSYGQADCKESEELGFEEMPPLEIPSAVALWRTVIRMPGSGSGYRSLCRDAGGETMRIAHSKKSLQDHMCSAYMVLSIFGGIYGFFRIKKSGRIAMDAPRFPFSGFRGLCKYL